MRIEVNATDGWSVTDRRDDGSVRLATGDGRIEIDLLPLQFRPADVTAGLRALVPALAAPGVRFGPAEARSTTHRWGYHLFATAALIDDRVVPGPLVAVYRFIEHMGVALVHAPAGPLSEIEKERVLELLGSARPDWRGPHVAAMAELWADAQNAKP